MTKKVTLPKEVAEAVEKLRRLDHGNKGIIDAAYGQMTGSNSYKVQRYSEESRENFDNLVRALYNGYDVEQTPEDKLLAYYNTEQKRFSPKYKTYFGGVQHGIRKTLNILGITIEG